MSIEKDPSLPPILLPNAPEPNAPAEANPVPPKAARAKRDSRSLLSQRELLRGTGSSDAINKPLEANISKLRSLSISPEVPTREISTSLAELGAYYRLMIMSQKTSESPGLDGVIIEIRRAVNDLAASRAAIKLSQKDELKQASERLNQKAKEAICLIFELLKAARRDDAFTLLGDVLTNDSYQEMDDYLFGMLTKDPVVEEPVVKKLLQYIVDTVATATVQTVFRDDPGWQQRLLRVMHNGYLSSLFLQLDKEIRKMGKTEYQEIVKGKEIVHVKEVGLEALQCVKCARQAIKILPDNLKRIYLTLYRSIDEKFKDHTFADLQLMQFIFLRAINPHLTKLHELDRYEKVDGALLEKESERRKQCGIVTKTIQSMIGFLKTVGDEKPDKIMTLKDAKSDYTLLQFVQEEKNLNKLRKFLNELKAHVLK